MSSSAPQVSFYDAIGGHDTFVALVKRFYEGVAGDPPLRALYPEEDLGPAEVRFRMFLEQYWGGPTTYSEQRGHPRLRMRHAPFAVTPEMRDRWLTHMRDAVDSLDLTEPQRERAVELPRAGRPLHGQHPRRGQRPEAGPDHPLSLPLERPADLPERSSDPGGCPGRRSA